MNQSDREYVEQLLRERVVRQAAWRILERSARESALRIVRRTDRLDTQGGTR